MKRTIKKLALWGFVTALIMAGLSFVFLDQLGEGGMRYLKRQTQESILRYGSELPAVGTSEVAPTLRRRPSGPNSRNLSCVSV